MHRFSEIFGSLLLSRQRDSPRNFCNTGLCVRVRSHSRPSKGRLPRMDSAVALFCHIGYNDLSYPLKPRGESCCNQQVLKIFHPVCGTSKSEVSSRCKRTTAIWLPPNQDDGSAEVGWKFRVLGKSGRALTPRTHPRKFLLAREAAPSVV